MDARLLAPEDITPSGLDALIDSNRFSDVRLAKDRIIVIGPLSHPTGCLVWRPCALIHEFRCGDSMIARRLAARLGDFAAADALSARFPIRDVLFHTFVHNTRMQSFAESFGAHRQPPGVLYRLSLGEV